MTQVQKVRQVVFISYLSTASDYQIIQLAEVLRKRQVQALAWPRAVDPDGKRLQTEVQYHGTSPVSLCVALGPKDPEDQEFAQSVIDLGAALGRRLARIVVIALSEESARPANVGGYRFFDLSGDKYATNLDSLALHLGASLSSVPKANELEYSVISGIFEAARPQSDMFAELKTQISRGSIDQKYLYWDVRAALRWQEIAELSTYLTAQSSMNLLGASAGRMLGHIAQDSRTLGFSFINFGVGTGVKDFLILDQLLREPEARVLYVPIDESLSMMQITIQSMQELISQYRARLKIHYVLDDFANVDRYMKHIAEQELAYFGETNSTRIVGFLGGSLGNFAERAVLADITTLLRSPSDRLILGIEFIAGRTDSELSANYEDQRMRQFLYGPILDVEATTPNWENDFRYRVIQDRSDVSDARTITGAVYFPRHEHFVELFYATKYEREPLESFLDEVGLRIVETFVSDDQPPRFGKYVLAKRP